MNDLWTQLASRARLELNPLQNDKLGKYLDLLLEANQRMNLTRILDRPAAEVQHVADALTLLIHFPDGPTQVADVGSGGGVPGIPLAIARPDLQMMLIESTKKKAGFLTDVVGQLRLQNVTIFEGRAEDAGSGPHREKFHVVTVRAVAEMGWLAEWCLPLVRPGGKMLAMKGPKWSEEMPAARRTIRVLGGGEPKAHEVNVPELPGHLIIEIKKVRPTPEKFPRPATAAKGKMLGQD